MTDKKQKTAFVFPGQGAQYPGMGRELFETRPEAREIFSRAEELRPGTLEQCFEGSAEDLSVTGNTQPCLFAVEAAYMAALTAAGVRADMAAGFSLGELSALACAGAADFETMFSLVCTRAKLMQEQAKIHPAAMAAVLKLTPDQVEEICARFSEVYPVNYNCPGQISVSCAEQELGAFAEAVKAAGGRAMPLKVKGGFHSPFMGAASTAFASALEHAPLGELSIPVYANRTARPYPENQEEKRELLAAQIASPVRWEESVRAMIADGADTFIEVGPGNVLAGMIRRIDKNVRVLSAEEALESRVSEGC